MNLCTWALVLKQERKLQQHGLDRMGMETYASHAHVNCSKAHSFNGLHIAAQLTHYGSSRISLCYWSVLLTISAKRNMASGTNR